MLSESNHNEYLNFRHFKMGREEGFTFFYNLYYAPLCKAGLRYIENNAVVEEVYTMPSWTPGN